jgi:starvation-inducible DNA-binding protein
MSTVTTALQTVLANTYALAIKTHAAHWNVTGHGFFQLHDAFGLQYNALFEAADEIAERLRALNEKAPVGMQALSKATTIKDFGQDSSGTHLAAILRDDHRIASKGCEAARAAAEAAQDEATVDMLIGRIDAHDKTAWMLDAYATI